MFGLPVIVVLGAVFIGFSIPVLWWSVAAEDPRHDVRDRLRVAGTTDLRRVVLSQGAHERMLAPGVQTLARWARAISPIGLVDRLDRKITLAGIAHKWPLERVLGTKLILGVGFGLIVAVRWICLLYTSPSPRDATLSRMPSSA